MPQRKRQDTKTKTKDVLIRLEKLVEETESIVEAAKGDALITHLTKLADETAGLVAGNKQKKGKR